jgi:hypothetical protein
MAKDTNKEDSSKLTKEEIRAAKAKIAAEKEYSHSLSYANVELRKAIGYLKDQSKSLDGLLRSSKALNDSTKQNAELKQDLASLLTNELQDASTLLLKRNMISTGLKGDYAQYITQYEIQHKGNAEMMKRVPALIEELKHRQHVNDETNKQTELYEEMGRKLAEIKEETEEWKHSLTKVFETAKAIGRDPKVFGAFMLTQMVDKVEQVHKGFEELGTSGLTVGQRVDSMAKGFSVMSMLGLSDTKGVLAGMVESMGTMNALTSAEVDHVGHLAKEMGVTGQEAFGLVEGFSKLPGETMATATHAADYVKSLSEANGVAPGKITKEIAKNTELMALGGYKSAKAFTDAAMKAQKMGVELATSKNVMNGLLNFEDSINAQMEASVLWGKEINFDKARELALSGKSVEATAEVLKNIGGQAEFEKMNVLQKQALAKASGMSVEELSKAVDAQAEFNKYHGEEASWLMKKVGLAAEYGGAAVGFAKENGTAMLASIQMLGMIGKSKMAEWVLDKAHHAWKKTAALAQAGWSKMTGLGKGGGVTDLVGKTKMPEVPAKADGLGAGKVAGGGMKGLASGFKAMAGGKVAQGILNLMLAGPALLLAVGSIPFLMVVSVLGTPAGLGLSGLSEGLKGKGMGAALVSKGIANLALYGLASIVAVLGLPFMVGVALLGYLAGLGMTGLATGLKAMAKVPLQGVLVLGLLGVALIPAAFAFSLLKGVDVGSIIAFSIALPLLALAAAGLGFLFPFIVAGAASLALLGVGMIAVAGGLMVLQAAEGGIAVFESLASIAANAAGLGGVAMAMIGIAGGLAIMGYSGLLALPVIGALIALATVAPALIGLGAALGGIFGGGGGEKEDKMDTLITKIDVLIGVASKGGTVNMDGKKVGEIVRLGINSSGVR